MKFEKSIIYRIIIFFIFLISAMFVNYQNQLYIGLPAVLILLLQNPKGAGILLKWKVWMFFLFILFIVPIFSFKRDAQFLSVPYSTKFFRMNVAIVWRAVIIILSLRALTHKISMKQLSSRIKKIKYYNFGEVLATALTVFPLVKEIVLDINNDWKKKRKRLLPSNILNSIVELFARVILYSEEYFIKNRE